MKVKLLKARVLGNVNHDEGAEVDVEDSVAEYLVKQGDAESDDSSLRQPVKGDPEPPAEASTPADDDPPAEADDKPATGPKRLGGR